MKEMFLICDKNGDGEVDLEEFVSVFQEMKISASSDDVVELFGVGLSFFFFFFFFFFSSFFFFFFNLFLLFFFFSPYLSPSLFLFSP